MRYFKYLILCWLRFSENRLSRPEFALWLKDVSQSTFFTISSKTLPRHDMKHIGLDEHSSFGSSPGFSKGIIVAFLHCIWNTFPLNDWFVMLSWTTIAFSGRSFSLALEILSPPRSLFVCSWFMLCCSAAVVNGLQHLFSASDLDFHPRSRFRSLFSFLTRGLSTFLLLKLETLAYFLLNPCVCSSLLSRSFLFLLRSAPFLVSAFCSSMVFIVLQIFEGFVFISNWSTKERHACLLLLFILRYLSFQIMSLFVLFASRWNFAYLSSTTPKKPPRIFFSIVKNRSWFLILCNLISIYFKAHCQVYPGRPKE